MCMARVDGGQRLLAFDAAASVPATDAVMSAVRSAMGTYGSVHRGFGPRSLASSDLYERARRTVASHFGVPETHCVVFTSNTTDAIVKLARALKPRTVANSIFEHSANDLPWRQAGHEVRGYEHFAGIRGDLIAWSGASNITGAITELSDMYQHIKGRGAPPICGCVSTCCTCTNPNWRAL
jgi:selenocysteine lyase/cysteine desulfurase